MVILCMPIIKTHSNGRRTTPGLQCFQSVRHFDCLRHRINGMLSVPQTPTRRK